ncbi:MAG: uncharacterized protein QOI73_3669 [Solirubrobacteraceae bacterium]|nr:uncharacterized protein [Solirubrobacteraceae bacterium]
MAHLKRTRRGAGAIALGCAAVALTASPAAAQVSAEQPTPVPHTITVTGTAQVKPKPRNPKSNESIAGAVAKARRAAIPLAIEDGKGRAATLSQLSGIPLGELTAIASAPAGGGPFFPGPYFGEDGTFGPGKYCATVRRPITRRDAAGKRHVVGTRARRQCRIPQYVSANLTMVFSTA